MGLDIRAFNGLKKLEDQTEDAFSKHNNCVNLIPNDTLFKQSSGLSGYYLFKGDYLTFRAGAYSSYGKWRSMLCEMMGYQPIEKLWSSFNREESLNVVLETVLDENTNDPFMELICFSDCEGFIGTRVSKKLYNDFVNNRQKAFDYSASKNNSDWLSLYDDFLNAFKIASKNGCVEFC